MKKKVIVIPFIIASSAHVIKGNFKEIVARGTYDFIQANILNKWR